MADKPARRWPGRSSSDDGLSDTSGWDQEAPDPAIFGSVDDGLSDRADGGRPATVDPGRRRSASLVNTLFKWFLCLLWLAFGAAFLVSGLLVRADTTPYRDGTTVSGEVVSIAETTNGEGDATYSPVVRFIDPATGESHRVTRSISSSNRPEVGDSWEVSFPPGEPERARVLGRWDWLFWGSFVTIGSVAIAINLLVTFRWATRSRRR